jgi:hypothetical protein
LHYLVASRHCERDPWLSEFEDLSGFEEVIRKPSPHNLFQKKSHIQVKRKQCEEGSHVLCLSSERVETDQAIREKQEARLRTDLEKLRNR